ncbi:tRNA threonylcarbamoyladenosine dehydratase [Eggerthellaceae bacterium zg-997]|nr:tRNA threonylcarbamoyladenosine dehydratase [Eggerthellaceae bacterium zg-997]
MIPAAGVARSAPERTEKLRVILGDAGVSALADACVMVLGTGGVGSNCVEALARGGVGRFVLVDRDVVSASNLNRQAIAFHSTLGQRKVDVMRRMVLDINPDAHVEVRDDFVRADNVAALLDAYRARVDWVVDAIDTVSTKIALAEYADRTHLPMISSMGGGNKLHPENLGFADIYATVNCPLCRIMRKECRKRGVSGLKVLYSCEQPARTSVAEGAVRSDRSDLGTMSYIPPIMGQMIAGWVIRQICGLDPSESPTCAHRDARPNPSVGAGSDTPHACR